MNPSEAVGLCCPEKLWLPCPWKFSWTGWMGLGAIWNSGRSPCPWQGVAMIFEVLSNPDNSVISIISGIVVLLHTGYGVSILLPSQVIPWQYSLLGCGPEKVPVLNQFPFCSLSPPCPQLERNLSSFGDHYTAKWKSHFAGSSWPGCESSTRDWALEKRCRAAF